MTSAAAVPITATSRLCAEVAGSVRRTSGAAGAVTSLEYRKAPEQSDVPPFAVAVAEKVVTLSAGTVTSRPSLPKVAALPLATSGPEQSGEAKIAIVLALAAVPDSRGSVAAFGLGGLLPVIAGAAGRTTSLSR